MNWNTIYFKGEIITRGSGDCWHVDFLEFKTLYEAKGYILRKVAGGSPRLLTPVLRAPEADLKRAA